MLQEELKDYFRLQLKTCYGAATSFFKKSAAAPGAQAANELCTGTPESDEYRLQHNEMEHMITFKKCSNELYYIALIPQELKEIICDCIGCLSGCNIFHALLLDSPLTSSNPKSLLDKVNDNDEAIPSAQKVVALIQ